MSEFSIGDLIEQKNLEERRLALEKLGLTDEKLEEMKAAAKRDENGKYIIDHSKPLGSIENPDVVGMPDCSDTLVFDLKKNRWLLTDGCGNGWIR